jgi:hypothetical protein
MLESGVNSDPGAVMVAALMAMVIWYDFTCSLSHTSYPTLFHEKKEKKPNKIMFSVGCWKKYRVLPKL